MNQAEWGRLAYTADNWWPQPGINDDREAAYFIALEPFDAAVVEAALKALLEEDLPFTPSASQIVSRCRAFDDRQETPTFYGAWEVIGWAMDRAGSDETRAMRILQTEHPLIGIFVRQQGYHRLAQEPIDDPDFGGAVRHRLQAAWTELARAYERGEVRERALATERRAISGPRQLDVSKHLKGAAKELAP